VSLIFKSDNNAFGDDRLISYSEFHTFFLWHWAGKGRTSYISTRNDFLPVLGANVVLRTLCQTSARSASIYCNR
jgi:hypothetical protein